MKITKEVKMLLKSIFLKCGSISTDKATLVYDNDELTEGVEVFVESTNEDGDTEMLHAENGEYKAEGMTITVEDGKISAIVKEEIEEPSQEQQEEALEEPLAEPADSTQEEGVTIEERVSAIESQIADYMAAIEAFTNSVASLESRIEEIETKIAKLDAEPATDAVEEEPLMEEKQTRLSYLKKNKNN